MRQVTMFCMRTNAGGEGFRQSFVYSRLFSNGGVTDARGMKERKKTHQKRSVSVELSSHTRGDKCRIRWTGAMKCRCRRCESPTSSTSLRQEWPPPGCDELWRGYVKMSLSPPLLLSPSPPPPAHSFHTPTTILWRNVSCQAGWRPSVTEWCRPRSQLSRASLGFQAHRAEVGAHDGASAV